MITVHHLNQSRSHRILWLLEELDLPYDVTYYQREKNMLAPESLKRIHPLGKSPIITDGELTLAESGAIIDYVEDRYDSAHLLSPADSHDDSWVRYRYWLHYAEGSLMPLLVMKLIFGMLSKPPVPWLARPIGAAVGKGVSQKYLDPQLLTHCRYLESHLSQYPWFAGERFSAADIQMSFPLEGLAARVGINGYPALQAYIDKLRQRPAYQRAKKREQHNE
ncbi:glutathione S-transferase [Acerihabitans sp. TG2]|uniref:glutathione S-transferase family protein n=1 Tax=Acerihabitans sp. TG2 TaxID=3096008 RepID=UPI002B23860D|nr:glutathione S-transferase [Acerihabitans sp. TG2]MEA9392883.1 glutathione S-transferase [Acerihabitans sp. TG2]